MPMRMSAVLAVSVCLLFASPILVKVATAQTTIPTLSVPEFSLKFVDNSYDNYVSPVSSTDPYTGTVTTIPGFYQHIENKSIEVIIRNQPSVYTEYFNISVKGHYTNDWVYYSYIYGYNDSTDYLEASNTTSTVIVFSLNQNNRPDKYAFRIEIGKIPAGGELDFRVQKYYGFISTTKNPYLRKNPYVNVTSSTLSEYIQVLNVTQTSNWSEIQTIAIPETPYPSPSESFSPSPTPEFTSPTASLSPLVTSTPIQPSGQISLPLWVFAAFAVMALAIGVLVGVVAMMRRRLKETSKVSS
jgi:hypothetical protein